MTVLQTGKPPMPVKLLMTAVVAGISIESVVIGAVIGGIFLVIQGAVQTLLSEYLREKRDESRRRRETTQCKNPESNWDNHHSDWNPPNRGRSSTPNHSRKPKGDKRGK